MISSNSDFKLIESIVRQLRVPEFKYASSDDVDEELACRILCFFDRCKINPDGFTGMTLMGLCEESFTNERLPPRFINLLFLGDRVFDVWLRKNRFDPKLEVHFNKLRFAFFQAMYHDWGEAILSIMFQLIDDISKYGQLWCSDNSRAEKLLMGEIDELFSDLFAGEKIDVHLVDNAYEAWHEFAAMQETKKKKILSRLIPVEERKARERYFKSKSVQFINSVFSNRFVPASLNNFIAADWSRCVEQAFLKNDPQIDEKIIQQTKRMILVFCKKGEAAFKVANQLLEEVSELSHNLIGELDPARWQALEQDVVNLLQNIGIDEEPYIPILGNDDLEKFRSFGSSTYEIGAIFEKANGARIELVDSYEKYGQVLFANYLGIKDSLLSFGDLSSYTLNKDLVLLNQFESFSEVVHATSSSLSRVANNQHKARLKAAEKAREEAELLLKKQQEAEALAIEKAEAIAKQTREIKAKKVEKQRAEKQQQYYDQLAVLKLGAWISVKEPETDSEKNYKLAVKFAATGKYLFVDKHGLKKLEFMEADLVSKLVTEEVKILSDGAEFEDSLERVVSRMRMMKKP